MSIHRRDPWAAQLQVLHFAAQGLDLRVGFAQQQRALLGGFLADDGHGLAPVRWMNKALSAQVLPGL